MFSILTRSTMVQSGGTTTATPDLSEAAVLIAAAAAVGNDFEALNSLISEEELQKDFAAEEEELFDFHDCTSSYADLSFDVQSQNSCNQSSLDVSPAWIGFGETEEEENREIRRVVCGGSHEDCSEIYSVHNNNNDISDLVLNDSLESVGGDDYEEEMMRDSALQIGGEQHADLWLDFYRSQRRLADAAAENASLMQQRHQYLPQRWSCSDRFRHDDDEVVALSHRNSPTHCGSRLSACLSANRAAEHNSARKRFDSSVNQPARCWSPPPSERTDVDAFPDSFQSEDVHNEEDQPPTSSGTNVVPDLELPLLLPQDFGTFSSRTPSAVPSGSASVSGAVSLAPSLSTATSTNAASPISRFGGPLDKRLHQSDEEHHHGHKSHDLTLSPIRSLAIDHHHGEAEFGFGAQHSTSVPRIIHEEMAAASPKRGQTQSNPLLTQSEDDASTLARVDRICDMAQWMQNTVDDLTMRHRHDPCHFYPPTLITTSPPPTAKRSNQQAAGAVSDEVPVSSVEDLPFFAYVRVATRLTAMQALDQLYVGACRLMPYEMWTVWISLYHRVYSSHQMETTRCIYCRPRHRSSSLWKAVVLCVTVTALCLWSYHSPQQQQVPHYTTISAAISTESLSWDSESPKVRRNDPFSFADKGERWSYPALNIDGEFIRL